MFIALKFAANVFTFFGFFFLLLIHRRNIENLSALEATADSAAEEQNNPVFKPVPTAWFLFCIASFAISTILRQYSISV